MARQIEDEIRMAVGLPTLAESGLEETRDEEDAKPAETNGVAAELEEASV